MGTPRTELQNELALLDRAMPGLIQEHPDDAEFWPAFAGMADVIQDAAGPEDFDWVLAQTDLILMRHGKMVGEDIPPSDDLPPL